MKRTYDLLASNDSTIDIAIHDGETTTYQWVGSGLFDGDFKKDYGPTPAPVSSMYMDSFTTTAAFARHHYSHTDEVLTERYGDEIHPAAFHNPFGLESIEDVKQLIKYRSYLDGSVHRSQELWDHIGKRNSGDMARLRWDAEDVLEYEDWLDNPEHMGHRLSVDHFIEILTIAEQFNRAIIDDPELHERYRQALARAYARQAVEAAL